MYWVSIQLDRVSHGQLVFSESLTISARMKALLFTLIRAFEIELAVSPEDIGKKGAVVQRPYVKSEPDAPNQMPLILKLVS